eukprot:888452-Amphidinium_carterae.1
MSYEMVMQVLPGPFGRQGAPVRPPSKQEEEAPGIGVLCHPGGEKGRRETLHTLGETDRGRKEVLRDRVLCTLADEVESRERSEETLGVGCTSPSPEALRRRGNSAKESRYSTKESRRWT